MLLPHQATLKKSLSFSGVTLHGGQQSTLFLHPAPENHGIVFLKEGVLIPVGLEFVLSTQFCVKLGTTSVSIQTVEHLLAALLMNQVTNLLCEVIGDEIPILDGSSRDFSKAIAEVGLFYQQGVKKIAKVTKPVTVSVGQSVATMTPSQETRYSITLDYDHPAISRETLYKSFCPQVDNYFAQIDHARTYGFLKDRELYKKMGLAQGASVETTLIFDEKQSINPEGMRSVDEVSSHKILDCIGDLSLIGSLFLGHYEAFRPGHSLNLAMVKALFDHHAIEWISAEEYLNVLAPCEE